jgi:hypothetical protein
MLEPSFCLLEIAKLFTGIMDTRFSVERIGDILGFPLSSPFQLAKQHT